MSDPQTTLRLLTAIENFIRTQQAFANDGGPDKWKAYVDAEINLKNVMTETNRKLHNG